MRMNSERFCNYEQMRNEHIGSTRMGSPNEEVSNHDILQIC
jgi:hypothetical protein